jgi:hypothetical protein
MKACALITLASALLLCSMTWANDSDLVWSTFLGGSNGDFSYGIVLDDCGNSYVTGKTFSPDFPTATGEFNSEHEGWDVFVVKLNPTGSALEYIAILGGSDNDEGRGIVLDDDDNAYVGGWTRSSNFPTTTGAFDISYNGDYDVFMAKLDPTGSILLYATFIGGSDEDRSYSIAVDGLGNAYATGRTWSANFPTTVGAYDVAFNGVEDVFVVKLNSDGSDLDYSTFLGGSSWDRGYDIAVGNVGNAYVTGVTWGEGFPTTTGAYDITHNGERDIFVAKLNSVGSDLDYCTFMGGSSWDWGNGITLDDAGNAYVTGRTYGFGFPTTSGSYDETYNGGGSDAFVAKLNAMGSDLEFSTFLGGSVNEGGFQGIALDDTGNVYVAGYTESPDFPTTPGAYDTSYNSDPLADAFVVKLNPSGSVLNYSTYLGGSVDDWAMCLAVDDSGNVYVTGYTFSIDFPVTQEAFDISQNGDYDAFVAKLRLGGIPVPVVLVSFEANGGQGFITLNWVTASEINCHRWEIYRGEEEDGEYVQIGELSGHGSTESSHIYRWVNRQVTAEMTYFYKLRQVDFDGSSSWSSVVSAAAGSAVPRTYVLAQNYPNPFNANTEIRYRIPKDCYVTLKIYNTLGQEMRTLVDADQSANGYAVRWNGHDDRGLEVASGTYFCRLQTGDFGKTIKMMFIK